MGTADLIQMPGTAFEISEHNTKSCSWEVHSSELYTVVILVWRTMFWKSQVISILHTKVAFKQAVILLYYMFLSKHRLNTQPSSKSWTDHFPWRLDSPLLWWYQAAELDGLVFASGFPSDCYMALHWGTMMLVYLQCICWRDASFCPASCSSLPLLGITIIWQSVALFNTSQNIFLRTIYIWYRLYRCKTVKTLTENTEKKHPMESLAKYYSCSTQRPLTGRRK